MAAGIRFVQFQQILTFREELVLHLEWVTDGKACPFNRFITHLLLLLVQLSRLSRVTKIPEHGSGRLGISRAAITSKLTEVMRLRRTNKMLYRVGLCICVFQFMQAANAQSSKIQVKPSPVEAWGDAAEQRLGLDAEQSLRKQVEYEEREFINRFNSLVDALRDFSSTCNAGHTIDVKKVTALRKAWRQLEKSDWFRPNKGE